MRVTYRHEETHAYWERRWSGIPADEAAENPAVYPLRYAELAIGGDREGRILEAGCGNGRVLRYYQERGHRITGMDYVSVSVEKLRAADPALDVRCGDVRAMEFPDSAFRYVLAFGLYHNLEPEDCRRALDETYRVLEPGGLVCASYRADNVHSRIIDRAAAQRSGAARGRHFHKMNLTRREVAALFGGAGFAVESVHAVENMPLLYKYRAFRARGHRAFDESRGRREGYRLSAGGRLVQGTLFRCFPDQFCNVFVVLARRPA
jgi:SAM-dependent methyltransferase